MRTKKLKIERKVRKVGANSYKVIDIIRDDRNRQLYKEESTIRYK